MWGFILTLVCTLQVFQLTFQLFLKWAGRFVLEPPFSPLLSTMAGARSPSPASMTVPEKFYGIRGTNVRLKTGVCLPLVVTNPKDSNPNPSVH